MIYFIVLIIILFLVKRFPSLTPKGKVAYKFLFFLLTIMAGLRYNVGNDTIYYTQEYNHFPNLFELDLQYFEESNYQILWILFESAMKTISPSFYLLQFVLAGFVNFAVFKTVAKYSSQPFLTIMFYYLIFYVNLNMEILRESIPICLFLLGIGFLERKEFLKYFLLAGFAFLFHESAILLFVVPFFFRESFNKVTYAIIIVLFYIFSEAVTTFIIQNLPYLDVISEAKLNYFQNSKDSENLAIFNIIKYVATPSAILFFFHRQLNEIEKKFLLLYILASILFLHFNIFYRVRDYFLIMFFISFTNGLMKRFGPRTNTINDLIKPGLVIIFLFLFLFRFYYQDLPGIKYQSYLNYYPYNSIFNETLPPERLQNIRGIYNTMQDLRN